MRHSDSSDCLPVRGMTTLYPGALTNTQCVCDARQFKDDRTAAPVCITCGVGLNLHHLKRLAKCDPEYQLLMQRVCFVSSLLPLPLPTPLPVPPAPSSPPSPHITFSIHKKLISVGLLLDVGARGPVPRARNGVTSGCPRARPPRVFWRDASSRRKLVLVSDSASPKVPMNISPFRRTSI